MRRKSLGAIFPSVTHFESVPSKRSKAPAVCPSRGPRRVRVIESSAPGSRPSQCGHLLGPAATGGCDQNISSHRARAAGLSSAPTGARDRRPRLHVKRPPAEEAPGREPWEHLRPSAWSFATLERLVPVHSARGTRSSQNSLGRCHVPGGAAGGACPCRGPCQPVTLWGLGVLAPRGGCTRGKQRPRRGRDWGTRRTLQGHVSKRRDRVNTGSCVVSSGESDPCEGLTTKQAGPAPTPRGGKQEVVRALWPKAIKRNVGSQVM